MLVLDQGGTVEQPRLRAVDPRGRAGDESLDHCSLLVGDALPIRLLLLKELMMLKVMRTQLMQRWSCGM